MTRLVKIVRREVGTLGLRGGDAGDFILTIYPGGTISLRRKRSHREYVLSLAECYCHAARLMARRKKEG
jgi:hypothetical protein